MFEICSMRDCNKIALFTPATIHMRIPLCQNHAEQFSLKNLGEEYIKGLTEGVCVRLTKELFLNPIVKG